MAVENGTRQKQSKQEWIATRIEVAKRQLQRVPELSRLLYSDHDLTGFLRLMSRFPYYSYQNLLIIYEKCPEATHLDAFANWQKLLDNPKTQRVLKNGAGSGMDILLPFTNPISDVDVQLSWWSLLVFDVRQTNVQNYKAKKSPYIMDNFHLAYLRKAVSDAISYRYQRRILFDPDTTSLQATGACGRISEHYVTIRRGLKEEKALFWLSEALCELSSEDLPISQSSKRFFAQCVHVCLYNTWQLSHPGILPGSHSVVPEEEWSEFLDLLQRKVFELCQILTGAYLMIRNE